MKKHQSIENLTKTYTCWIAVSCTLPGNLLPPEITKEHLEEYLTVKSKEIGEFHSLKLDKNEKYKNYQCFINFLSEKCANKAVSFFNRVELSNLKLEAKIRQAEKINEKNQNPLLSSDLKFKDKPRSSSQSRKNEKINPLTAMDASGKKSKSSIQQTEKKDNGPTRKDNQSNTKCFIKRYIVIDGNNVAINHGREKVFSSEGIKITVDYFKKRGLTDIVAIVPEFRRTNFKGEFPTKNPEILEQLYDQKHIMFTPSMCYDDGFILEYAKIKDAIIVSNDRYRDLIFAEKYAEQTKRNLVPFSIFDDVFLPANDPYGRNGPTLDQMLLSNNFNENMASKLISSVAPITEKARANEKPKRQNSNNYNNQNDDLNKKNQSTKTPLIVDSNDATEFKTKLKENRKQKKPLENLKENKAPNKVDPKNAEEKSPKGSNSLKKDPYSIFDDTDDHFMNKAKSLDSDESSDEDKDQAPYFDTDDGEDDNESKLNTNNEVDSEFPYKHVVVLKNAKKFRRHFTVKKADLADASTHITVCKVQEKRASTSLLFRIKSNDKNKFEKAITTIKSWRITKKMYSFNKDEFNQLLPLKKNLINGLSKNLKDKKEIFIIFDPTRHKVAVMIADNSKTRAIISNFESFCFGKINSTYEVRPKNELEYELIAYSLNNKDFLKKNKLNSFQLDIKKPIKEKSFNGIFIFNGKKTQFKEVNFQKILRVFFQHGTFVFNKKDHSFIKNRLDRIRRDLKKSFILLEFEIMGTVTNEQSLKFEILGFDQTKVEHIKTEFLDFLKKASSKIIQLNPQDDLAKIDQIVKEFKNNSASDDVNSENGDKSTLFNFDMDVEIVFNQQKRIIFLNGTNVEELNEIKNDLSDKINGSKKSRLSLKYPSLVFMTLVKERYLENIRPKYLGTKISFNRNYVYINGTKEELDGIIKELDQICSNISDQILTFKIPVKRSEFAYLETRENDIKILEKEMNCMIQLSLFERHAFASMQNKFKIELIHGDFTKLHVDAYICPEANNNSKNNESVFENMSKAENKGAAMNEDIFISSSGNLGCKSNSIIVHVNVPVCDGGFGWEEASKLRYAVMKSLFKVDEKYGTTSKQTISIAILPFSQMKNSSKITTEALIDYLMGQVDSKIRDVFLISHELEKVREWEESLIQIPIKGLEINASRNVAGKGASSSNSNQIFVSANKAQINNVEKKIRTIIEQGYVSERVPYDSISYDQIEQLEAEYEAVICKDGDSLIVSAIEENLLKLKNMLLDFDLISFDD